MLIATAGEICLAINGRLESGITTTRVTGISTDSRTIKAGMAFVALKGERYDGHKFITAALKSGAAAAIGEYFPLEAVKARQQEQALIRVPDSLQALQKLAAYHRNKNFAGPLIAVTGSSGKTTTKNLVAVALSSAYKVLKTPGNFNNEIGLPLTLLGLAPEHQAVVVEMAMRGRGEINSLCEIAQPNIGVITNVGTAHLELLGSVANIAAAKGELLNFLKPDDLAIINGDDEWCRKLAVTCRCRVIFYGMQSHVDIAARNVTSLGTEGTSFIAVFPGEEVPAQIPVPGLHNVYNTLAALAAGYYLGLTPSDMVKSLAVWPPEELRQELRPGPGGCLVYNDAYNANPESMQAALQVLAGLPGRKVAVLGEMFELGPETTLFHHNIGRIAAGIGLYRLITVGKLAEAIADGAVSAGMPEEQVFVCNEHRQAVQYLQDLGVGDIVLFKGSRMAGMEKALAIWEDAAND